MSVLPLALAVLLLGQAAPPRGAPVRPPAPAGLSWEDADYVAGTIARIERRLTAGKPASRQPVVVTERQLNSYVRLATKLPPALTNLELGLQKDMLLARGTVDLDQVKSGMPQGAGLLALLSGTVPVELRGRVWSAEGTGRVEVEQATVAGISLPASLVAQIVSQSTKNAQHPQGFDILAPFPLPYRARRVRLEPGRALVEFYQ